MVTSRPTAPANQSVLGVDPLTGKVGSGKKGFKRYNTHATFLSGSKEDCLRDNCSYSPFKLFLFCDLCDGCGWARWTSRPLTTGTQLHTSPSPSPTTSKNTVYEYTDLHTNIPISTSHSGGSNLPPPSHFEMLGKAGTSQPSSITTDTIIISHSHNKPPFSFFFKARQLSSSTYHMKPGPRPPNHSCGDRPRTHPRFRSPPQPNPKPSPAHTQSRVLLAEIQHRPVHLHHHTHANINPSERSTHNTLLITIMEYYQGRRQLRWKLRIQSSHLFWFIFYFYLSTPLCTNHPIILYSRIVEVFRLTMKTFYLLLKPIGLWWCACRKPTWPSPPLPFLIMSYTVPPIIVCLSICLHPAFY